MVGELRKQTPVEPDDFDDGVSIDMHGSSPSSLSFVEAQLHGFFSKSFGLPEASRRVVISIFSGEEDSGEDERFQQEDSSSLLLESDDYDAFGQPPPLVQIHDARELQREQEHMDLYKSQ